MPRLSAETPFIHPDCEVTESTLGGWVEIGKGSRVHRSTIGDYSYCDRYADIANATVGKFSNISSFTRIGPTDHPMEQPALHHFVYRAYDYWDDAERDEAFFAARHARRVTIGHDTWIGHGAIIRPELTIGHGAVIAAGAVVTHDVPDYTIVTGVPAKPLRRRFSPAIAERLLALAWWDWSHEALRAALSDFQQCSVEAFLERHGG
ncbi:MAG: hypothetical protein RI516_03450 [Spiribacter sp.]|nr:hypothetical protein [Spiribacter sp.]MDR9481018.1 hypothetical protein [Spiribacter sp.]